MGNRSATLASWCREDGKLSGLYFRREIESLKFSCHQMLSVARLPRSPIFADLLMTTDICLMTALRNTDSLNHVRGSRLCLCPQMDRDQFAAGLTRLAKGTADVHQTFWVSWVAQWETCRLRG